MTTAPFGFLRVGAACPPVRVADPERNAEVTLEFLARARARGVQVLVLPELGLTGYTCGDLFFSLSTLVAGAERALGRWLVTLDADGQNDPADIAALWRALGEAAADVVQGVRVRRADGWLRRASSRVANSVRDRLSGDRVTDVGCSLRIMPRDLFLAAPRFEGMHRFLPTLLRMIGATVVERPVGHRPRRAGRTKYTIRNRIWKALADLLMVRRLRRGWVRYGVLGEESGVPIRQGGTDAPGVEGRRGHRTGSGEIFGEQ